MTYVHALTLCFFLFSVLVFVAFGVESGIDNAIISNVKSISQGTMNNSDGSTVDISGYITSVEPIRYCGVNNL